MAVMLGHYGPLAAMAAKDKEPIDPVWLCSALSEVVPEETIVGQPAVMRHVAWIRPAARTLRWIWERVEPPGQPKGALQNALAAVNKGKVAVYMARAAAHTRHIRPRTAMAIPRRTTYRFSSYIILISLCKSAKIP
jgi:hypothetical protein